MRLSDATSMKIMTDARIEALRGRKLPRRPKSARPN